jgi:TetR/AcrR family transcriptional regulator
MKQNREKRIMDAESQDKRKRDSRKAREAILDAAEAVFAQHGFAGARIDAIANASGYNSGLLFRYFGDKLGLYAEVLKRVDREVDELLAHVFMPLLNDEVTVSHAPQFRPFLETMIKTFFDYLLEHPRIVSILTWEMAEGWQMFAKITSQFPTENNEQFEIFFHKAWMAGLLRSDFIPKIQFSMIFQMCQTYLASLPLYQMMLSGEDLAATGHFARARKYLINFIVAGMMSDPDGTKPTI